MAAASLDVNVLRAAEETSPQSTSGEGFSKPRKVGGLYHNPWQTWRKPSFKEFFHFMFLAEDHSNIPRDKKVLDETLPVVKPDFTEFTQSPSTGIRHVWIGHATSLVQLDGVTFLTDPVFSDRSSPVQWIGVKRYRPPPCTIKELPKIDFVVISHNHYDHLDYNSVLALNQRFGKDLRWYVPEGNGKWMHDRGCENVVELTWWGEHTYKGSQGEVTVACTPCQHWTKRTLNNDNKVLWSSWCVLGPRHKFYFAGDTGYCDTFKEIGKHYGPFNLATIPIGAYCPRDFLQSQHVDPKQAIDIHTDIRSQQSVGIHWGTFNLSREHYLEPPRLVTDELKKRGLEATDFLTVKHGEVKVLGHGAEVETTTQAQQ